MLVGALGDIHGDFDAARRVVERHPDVPLWICVGDVADADGRYQAIGAPLYWIKGNNENFDLIASADFPPGFHYIPNGAAVTIGASPGVSASPPCPPPSVFLCASGSASLRVAGLGGTFAPTLYDLPAAELPHPKKGTAKATELADRRRHFVREEVEACKAMAGIDILLTHEAARPYIVEHGRRSDAGKTPINELLAAMQPRLHLFGHHHRFTEGDRLGVRSVGLALVSSSYLLIDVETLDYHIGS